MDYVTFPFEKFVSCITTEYDVQADSILALYIEIGKYLRDNPIVSGLTVKEIIDKYLEENPPTVGVASVNGKTGVVAGLYDAENPPPYPVRSVNGKTGVVTGLYDAENPPPYPVRSVNGKTGDVIIQEGSGTSGVISVNGKTGSVVVGEAGVVDEESEATQYMQIFVDESQDYDPNINANRLNGRPADEYMLKTDTAPDSEKLGGQLPKYYMKDFGRDELLWEGSWASGNINVPSTQDYMIYRIKMAGQGTAVLAIRLDGYIRGIGGYSSASATIMTYHFAATVEGNTWTFVACNSMRHISEAAHGKASDVTITGIYGIC